MSFLSLPTSASASAGRKSKKIHDENSLDDINPAEDSDAGANYEVPSSERVLKRRKKKEEKKKMNLVLAGKGTRADFVNVYGPNARVEIKLKNDSFSRRDNRLSPWDFQSFILWSLADVLQPRWCFIEKKPLIEKIVIVQVDGLTPSTFEFLPHLLSSESLSKSPLSPVSQSPFTKTCERIIQLLPEQLNRSLCITLNTPCSLFSSHSVPLSLLAVKSSNLEENKSKKSSASVDDSMSAAVARLAAVAAAPNCHQVADQSSEDSLTLASSVLAPIDDYVLSEHELTQNKFPRLTFESHIPPLFCQAPDRDDEKRSIFAVDCEMVTTVDGLELARVSLVNQALDVCLDMLVVPENPILDYNTQWSGLTEDSLAGVTTRLKDVQRQLCTLISSQSLLIGHSLENDLMALKLIHSRCIDTSLLFPHPRGPPYRSSLKFLFEKYLGSKIQANAGGHDSIEDARAAMMLVNLKVSKGPSFGVGSSETESLFVTLSRHRRACSMLAHPDTLKTLAPSCISALPCDSDDEVVLKAQSEIASKNDFLWIVLRELLPPLHQIYSKKSDLSQDASVSFVEAITCLKKQLNTLKSFCPTNTVFIVLGGQGLSVVRKMQETKLSKASVWTEAEEAELKLAIHQSASTSAFIDVL